VWRPVEVRFVWVRLAGRVQLRIECYMIRSSRLGDVQSLSHAISAQSLLGMTERYRLGISTQVHSSCREPFNHLAHGSDGESSVRVRQNYRLALAEMNESTPRTAKSPTDYLVLRHVM